MYSIIVNIVDIITIIVDIIIIIVNVIIVNVIIVSIMIEYEHQQSVTTFPCPGTIPVNLTPC